MGADLSGFDAREVEPMDSFEPLPAGTYLAVITASEMKPTKSGTGKYLELAFQVLEGEYKGRKVWARLNLENPSSVAVRMARSELSDICKAVGVITPNDSEELHDLPLEIEVAVKRRSDTGKMTNEIKGYSKKSSPGQTPQAEGNTPPWKRR
ncbi:MAG: DUF669 domain-containing protein [Planctomycetota bacterium]